MSVIGRKGRNPTGKRPVMAMDNSSGSEECEFSDIGAIVYCGRLILTYLNSPFGLSYVTYCVTCAFT